MIEDGVSQSHLPDQQRDGEPGWLPDEKWAEVTEMVPIACVDILPVRYNSDQRVDSVGLIRRKWPDSKRLVWCHIGGRVRRNETLSDAISRHLDDSVYTDNEPVVSTEPYFVNQYFTKDGGSEGFDPRKHAIAACYIAEFEASAAPRARGSEAEEFHWFRVDQLPADEDLWPGTKAMITHPGLIRPRAAVESYTALSARCVSHNELLWQTPVLAMTAMAFLLTIALGVSDDWRRALAAGLSGVIAVVSAQLFARHSASQLRDADALNSLENRLGLLPINRKSPPPKLEWEWPTRSALAKRVSRDWWFRSLMLFALVSFALCLASLISAFI